MSLDERTYWRDHQLSIRHREWGSDIPMVDIDFLAVEYFFAKPVAIVEYKNERAPPQVVGNPSYRAICALADASQIPFFVVRYASDFAWFLVVCINAHASHACNQFGLGSPGEVAGRWMMNEEEWVEMLHRLRGTTTPQDIALWLRQQALQHDTSDTW